MRNIFVIFILFFTLGSSAQQLGSVPSFFRVQRELPLLDLNTTTTINVSDYGAIVNDGKDDVTAIRNAINAVKNIATAQNPVRLLFESGTYDIMYEGNSSHIIDIADINGLLWDGQNAEFLLHNPTVGFLALLSCENTVLKDFSIDHATLPFSQGIVTNINVEEGYFDFVLEDFSPEPTTNPFFNSPQRWGMFKNAKGGIKEGTKNLIPHNRFFESIGPRMYRYGAQNANTLVNAEVGDYFVHIGRYNGSTLIRNTQGKNVTYLNITGYASASGGFNSRDCHEWNVINCHIKLKEGRVHSVNADAMHTNGNYIGPWVENCSFEGFSDDFMNIKYSRRTIKEIHSPTELTIQFGLDVGEKLEFFNPREAELIGTATVSAVQNLGSNLFRITLSNAVNLTTINEDDDQLADKLYVESRSNESFIFRNNIVRNSRRYGILIQSKYALIENNLFQNLSGAGIRIENGVDWTEGFRAHEIEIRNNRFENCGYDNSYIEEENSATISIDFAKVKIPCVRNGRFCGTETSEYRAHSNIRIIDNTILYNKKGMYLKNIQGLTVSNNFICHRDEDITLNNNENPEDITILNSENVSNTAKEATLPNANFQFLLNDASQEKTINNTGSNQNIGVEVNTTDGEIIQGFIDSEIGNTFKINTAGNGRLSLINKNDNSVYAGPLKGQARSYSFWIKPEEAIFHTLLYSGGPLEGSVFAIQMQTNGVLRVTDNNNNFVKMDDMPLDIGKWNHVAVTVPENNTFFSIQLYKNGVASNETKNGKNVLINTADNKVDFVPRFKGLISDIRFFDYKLCGAQVETIYNDWQRALSTQDLNIVNNKITVYPTITKGKINFSKPIQYLTIYNLLGKKYISKTNINTDSFDVSKLSPGLYILKINNQQITKILKE